MDEIIIVVEKNEYDCEYFCRNCGQLRLWLKGFKVVNCTACGSTNIVTGQINNAELTTMRANFQAVLRDREKRQF